MSSYTSRTRRPFAHTNRKPRGFSVSRSNNTKRRAGQYIDPARFVRVATGAEAEAYDSTHQFADFAVSDLIKRNLAAKGYVTPSPIQDQAIPQALTGQDIIGIANTGTGKTAAFAVPLLNRLLHDKQARALIIAPTRELAQQIEEECCAIAKGSNLTTVLLIGGANIRPQLRVLQQRPRIVIGTPGRIKDHLERNSLSLTYFNLVVLDEVDRMLDMGFVHDVTRILSKLAPVRQSFFFSATMDERVRNLIQTFAKTPVTVSVKSGNTSENVHQDVVPFALDTEKLDKLHDILIQSGVEKVIVFDETQRRVERLSKSLQSRGFSVGSIHGGKSQGQRQRALASFKRGDINVLVATDVAARGIDVSDITHVINYSTPQSYEDYVHRIGRAGRAGRIGYALTFVSK